MKGGLADDYASARRQLAARQAALIRREITEEDWPAPEEIERIAESPGRRAVEAQRLKDAMLVGRTVLAETESEVLPGSFCVITGIRGLLNA